MRAGNSNSNGPVTVAVTGSFASGKSTFTRMLSELGAETTSSDEIVHDLYTSDPETRRLVSERFGDQVLDSEGGIDRKELGAVVFGDPGALEDLEGILHPLVRKETDRRVGVSCAELFVVEVPLLFETGRNEDFDWTIAVAVPEERRREWSEERGVGEESLRGIEARQLPAEEKARRADIVVENSGGLELLKRRAVEVMERLSRESPRRHGRAIGFHEVREDDEERGGRSSKDGE